MSPSLHGNPYQVDDSLLIAAAVEVLADCGYELTWTRGPLSRVIMKFHTRATGSAEFEDWDAELGRADLALIVAMVLGLEGEAFVR